MIIVFSSPLKLKDLASIL